MLSTFNLKKLHTLLQDFYNLTGIRITIFDETFTDLISYPEQIAPICRFIRQNPEAAKACHNCDMNACHTALHRKKPYIYQCHAGLTEAVAPVFIGNLPVAYLLFGHLFSYPTTYAGWITIKKSCEKYDLDQAELQALVTALPITGQDKILSASHILQAVAAYLCYDQMISLKQQELPVQLDEYITQNLRQKINTRTLCEHFHIGKTTLYQISKEHYGQGIAEHIRSLRIEHAKKLLSEKQELSISEIAEECGFSDYNYFITVFRKMTGVSPKRFRKAASSAEKQ